MNPMNGLQFIKFWIGDNWSIYATGVTGLMVAIMLWVPETLEIADYRSRSRP
jgi:hypothetical protein